MKIRLSLVLLILLLLSVISYAQDEITVPPHSLFSFTIEGFQHDYVRFDETEWLADSSAVRLPYFLDAQSFGTNRLLQFTVETKNIRTLERYPCDVAFSPEQAEMFDAGNRCLRTLSPNGRYSLYNTRQQQCGESCFPILGLIDRKANLHVTIHGYISSSYFVRWSENSQAFILLSGSNVIFYVRIPETLSGISELEAIVVEEYQPQSPGFLDISPDGWQVLVRASDNILYGLTLWDARWPSTHQQFAARADGQMFLEDQQVDGAKFLTDDPNHILVVVDRGIVQYNIETQEQTLINSDVSSKWVDWVYFSPDEQYALAYQHTPYGQAGYQVSLFRVHASEDSP